MAELAGTNLPLWLRIERNGNAAVLKYSTAAPTNLERSGLAHRWMHGLRRNHAARNNALARSRKAAAPRAAHGRRVQEAPGELEASKERCYMTARRPKLSVLPGTTVTLSGSPYCRFRRFSPRNVNDSPPKRFLPRLARRRVTPLYRSQ